MTRENTHPEIPSVESSWSPRTKQVSEFMSAFGQPVRTNPFEDVTEEDRVLRARLILEEALEFALAVGLDVSVNGGPVVTDPKDFTTVVNPDYSYDRVEALDALTDLEVVVHGSYVQLGLPESEAFQNVHDSNMSKLGEDGKAIFDQYGKILKGSGYFAPELSPFIEKYRPTEEQ